MRLSLSAIFSLIGFLLLAQEGDTTDVKIRKFQPRLYWDYGKTALLWMPESKRHEGGGELLILDKFQLVGEYGYGQYTPEEFYKNIDYTVEGTYWRAGVGYLGRLDPINRIGLGLRYAQSGFEDGGKVIIRSESGFNDDLVEDFSRQNLSARWLEFVLNSERKLTVYKKNRSAMINDRFSVGLMIRYRILLDSPVDDQEFETISLFAIPGYGRAVNSSVLAFNLFLKVNF